MVFLHVLDVDVRDIREQAYDLVLFASGYEPRATFAARVLKVPQIVAGVVVVLGFEENREMGARIANDAFFLDTFGSEPIIRSVSNDEHLYELLAAVIPHDKKHVKILVDYSSMPRLWYGALLNWARYQERNDRVSVDFVYSVGKYDAPVPPILIRDLFPIPGFEGGGMSMFTSVAIFGLGYDTWGTLCALDLLEPDLIYCYLATQVGIVDSGRRARELNHELLQQARAVVELPLTSVEVSFTHLAELAAAHRNGADVCLVPMGPKPHALASMLVSLRFGDVGCLRVSGERSPLLPIEADGQLVTTRVEFVSTSESREERQTRSSYEMTDD